MVATIILNQSNVVDNGQNNQLVYNFPNSIAFPNHEIAIQNLSMYYSWANINGTSLNNNSYCVYFPLSGGYACLNVLMPDGLYEINTINQYLQFFCIQQGWFLISSTGAYVYFLEWSVNTSIYGIQLNSYPVPTALPAGWTAPSTAAGFPKDWNGYPDSAECPLVTFYVPGVNNQNNFYQIVGFPQDFNQYDNPAYEIDPAVNNSVVSTTAPQVQPNPTLYVSISNIENNMATPSSIIGTVTPNVNYGELISITPPQFAWNKLLSGTYNSLRITMLGSNKAPISLLDPNMSITLVIRDKNDVTLRDALSSATGGK